MIANNKFQNSFRALNYILVLGRQMAYDEAPHEDIASVLDIAEYLPRLFADPADCTAAFRSQVLHLATRWPQFSRALEYFDAPSLEWPW